MTRMVMGIVTAQYTHNLFDAFHPFFAKVKRTCNYLSEAPTMGKSGTYKKKRVAGRKVTVKSAMDFVILLLSKSTA